MDYCLIAFVFLGTLAGYRKGMIVALMSFLGWVIAGIGAFMVTPWTMVYLDGRIGLTASVAKLLRERLPVASVPAGTSKFPSTLIDLGGLSQYIQDIWVLTPVNSGGLADVLSSQAASMLANGLVFAVLFLVFLFLVHFLARYFSGRMQGTLLGFFNRLGGMFIGTAVNIMAAVLAVGIIVPWLAISAGTSTGILSSLSNAFTESTIAPYLTVLYGWVTALLSGVPV